MHQIAGQAGINDFSDADAEAMARLRELAAGLLTPAHEQARVNGQDLATRRAAAACPLDIPG